MAGWYDICPWPHAGGMPRDLRNLRNHFVSECGSGDGIIVSESSETKQQQGTDDLFSARVVTRSESVLESESLPASGSNLAADRYRFRYRPQLRSVAAEHREESGG